MNPLLMQAIVEFILFLDLSGEEVVDPDTATQQLEQVGWFLDKLMPDDRVVFTGHVKQMMQSYEQWRPDYDRVIRSLSHLVDDLSGND